ncbi:type II toxin-antitoxin system VapC family toxin [Microcoleus sp. FACHB-831]|uniref:type II toxin-antitoxin system VapC family toxin n=1 Tax=Microcoleus sp. FACHB-831 TaxID=2692827 RepID=UPI0016824CD2|nr:type II toxin-antitoxin system VapC family toxin [Microcoleus sp. FACHB-831]MBD1920314.1 type II toxin-antitoxin system VapC family toxin [Microcoleus sp. FACHB-831]
MLLDTHTLIWFLEGNPKLPLIVRQRIEDSSLVFVSIASLWEIAIKLGLGKLNFQFEFQEIPAFLEQLEIVVLPITFSDVECYLKQPLHHRDPFDRILVAQAINHSLVLISRDVAFDAYSVQRLWS